MVQLHGLRIIESIRVTERLPELATQPSNSLVLLHISKCSLQNPKERDAPCLYRELRQLHAPLLHKHHIIFKEK